mmetsp:Transcript_28009/g.77404  ORF Transcript_28009/g.77404 Transcript_28009/m.77404 type:complete len:232 (+) Transcript_28009:92-787(+)
MSALRIALRRSTAVTQPLCRAPTRSSAPPTILASAPRAFAAAAAAKRPKMDDGTLEGRYATALFMASGNNLEKVYSDLVELKAMMAESKEFKLMVEAPGIQPEAKVAALEQVCSEVGTDPSVVNFLKVLVENKRMHLLEKMINLFESFYRAEKGHVLCKVTSAAALDSRQKTAVKKAMQKRAEKGSTLIMEYDVSPAVLGGLVVKMGEAVYDFSVTTRLERLQTQLLAPLE